MAAKMAKNLKRRGRKGGKDIQRRSVFELYPVGNNPDIHITKILCPFAAFAIQILCPLCD